MKKICDACTPRVMEEERLMENFQNKAEGVDSKWQEVANIFELSKH